MTIGWILFIWIFGVVCGTVLGWYIWKKSKID